MPQRYKDYPIYQYDEPAIYDDFSGGINTDPSNEHLTNNELRDCINMTYKSGALIKRPGLSIVNNIVCEDELYNIQGIFLFTYKLTYIIVVSDGKLYQGYYNDKGNIILSRLHIMFDVDDNDIYNNPLNQFISLPIKYTEEINTVHDGYALYVYNSQLNKYDIELIFQNNKKIESATYNNKLLIPTGTRLVEVYYSASDNKLLAKPIVPYVCNNTEIIKIGLNYLSPFPQICRQTQKDTVTTSISGLIVLKHTNNTYELVPQMTFAIGDDEDDYYYRWEKKINKKWYVVHTFKSKNLLDDVINSTLTVTDANLFEYKITIAKDFDGTEDVSLFDSTTNEYQTCTDYKINMVSGSFFGSATSSLWKEYEVDQLYLTIQSCTKIHIDGNKFLLYDDKYNSGMWFKSIVNNPYYITQRGCLNFKTTKNESVIKVVSFQGAIIVFANSDNIGGSIHLVKGNGDDYELDEYYSPYRRFTKNTSISCDNADTVQICENLLIFKYFNTVYCISSSELTNEMFSIISCNDRIKESNKDVEIPWDDNNCISESTRDYYGLIWKESYYVDSSGDLILKHPAMRIKLYYKIPKQINERYYMPWLRDESKYLNISNIIYIKGEPYYIYNNVILKNSYDSYIDIDTLYECLIKTKAVDVNNPGQLKLLSSVLIYYHHNQYSEIDFNIICKNEAGHLLFDSNNKLNLQDLRVLKADDILQGKFRLDSTSLDSRLLNTSFKFPWLLIESTITSRNDKEFSLSSITYTYTTTEMPDSNPYDLYTKILRPKEVK